MANATGVIIYRGPSELDGSPIVAIATGIDSRSSRNVKTGAMIQTWILREDIAPTVAVRTGGDASICGDCPHRGTSDGARHGIGRTCYVIMHQGPLSVWRAFKRGNYPGAVVSVDDAGRPFIVNPNERNGSAPVAARRMVRIGSYGDPAAVPVDVWDRLTVGATGWAGYTHAWRRMPVRPFLARYCMASADTIEDRDEAKRLGWRTFRVSMPQFGDPAMVRGESVCPASKEAGFKLTCETCRACNGNATGRFGDITIQAHGGVQIMAHVAALRARLIPALTVAA